MVQMSQQQVAQIGWPQLAVINGMELTAVPPAGKLIKTVR